MVKIKICGITSLQEVEFLNRIYPEYIGFVFSESVRKVTIKEALKLSEYLNKKICRVGVFRNESINRIKEVALSGVIDIIQLHGNEDEAFINKVLELNMEVWKGISIKEKKEVNLDYKVDKLLLDGGNPGGGDTFNWEEIKNVPKGIILAGGINEGNVLEGIRKFSPYGVDVSSGVEGIVNNIRMKDENKVRRFIRKVRYLNEGEI